MNKKTTLGKQFRDLLGHKEGTEGTRTTALIAQLDDTNGRPLVEAVRATAHQAAGVLMKFAEPEIGLATSYESGNPPQGQASRRARQVAGLTTAPGSSVTKKPE